MSEPMKWLAATGIAITIPIWGLPYMAWQLVLSIKEDVLDDIGTL